MQQTVISILLWLLLLLSIVDATTDAPNNHSVMFGVIIGLSALFVVILIMVIVICICKRRRKRNNEVKTTPVEQPVPATSSIPTNIPVAVEENPQKSEKNSDCPVDKTQESQKESQVENEIDRPESNRKTKISKRDKKQQKTRSIVAGTEYWNENSAKMLKEIMKKSQPGTIEINEAVFGYSADNNPAPVHLLFPHTGQTKAAEKEAQQKEAAQAKAVFDVTQGSALSPLAGSKDKEKAMPDSLAHNSPRTARTQSPAASKEKQSPGKSPGHSSTQSTPTPTAMAKAALQSTQSAPISMAKSAVQTTQSPRQSKEQGQSMAKSLVQRTQVEAPTKDSQRGAAP